MKSSLRKGRNALFDEKILKSSDQFWDLFGEVEHETLDFKGGPGDSFKELLPAMAMADGGLVILGGVSTAEAASLLGVDRAVARKILNNLTAAGKVRPVGKTRARRYLPVANAQS